MSALAFKVKHLLHAELMIILHGAPVLHKPLQLLFTFLPPEQHASPRAPSHPKASPKAQKMDSSDSEGGEKGHLKPVGWSRRYEKTS